MTLSLPVTAHFWRLVAVDFGHIRYKSGQTTTCLEVGLDTPLTGCATPAVTWDTRGTACATPAITQGTRGTAVDTPAITRGTPGVCGDKRNLGGSYDLLPWQLTPSLEGKNSCVCVAATTLFQPASRYINVSHILYILL